MLDEKTRDYYDAMRLEGDGDAENQKQLVDEILAHYEADWMAKNRFNLFNVWQNVETYWEGEANEAYYEGDPASNTNIFHANIEALTSLLIDKNMSVSSVATSKSEQPYLSDINTMMNKVLKLSGAVTAVERFSRKLVKFGTGIFKVVWDFDGFNGRGCPRITTVNPAYFFVDSNIVNIEDVNHSAEVHIETFRRSIHSARREYGDRVDFIQTGYHPPYMTDFFKEDLHESINISREHYIHMDVYKVELVPDESSDDQELAQLLGQEHAYTKYKKECRYIEMSMDGIILRDSKDDGGLYLPYGKSPYFMLGNYEREGIIWSKGDAELLFDSQDQLNDYDDQIRSNARLLGNPQKWVDVTAGFDPELWTNDRGLVIPVAGGKESLGYIATNAISQDIVARRDRVMDVDAPRITRINTQMMGQRQKGVDTATESLALHQSSMSIVEQKRYKLERLLDEVVEYMFYLCIHHWDQEMLFDIAGTKDFISFTPSKLQQIPVLTEPDEEYTKAYKKRNKNKSPMYMIVEGDDGKAKTKEIDLGFSFRIGTGTSQNKAFTYSVMKEGGMSGLIKKSTYLKYLRDEIEVPIPQEDIEEAVVMEKMMLQQALTMQMMMGQQGAQQGPQQEAQAPQQSQAQKRGQEGASDTGLMGINPNGNPKRPNSPAKRGADSIGATFRT